MTVRQGGTRVLFDAPGLRGWSGFVHLFLFFGVFADGCVFDSADDCPLP
jgi:hypothetical protein